MYLLCDEEYLIGVRDLFLDYGAAFHRPLFWFFPICIRFCSPLILQQNVFLYSVSSAYSAITTRSVTRNTLQDLFLMQKSLIVLKGYNIYALYNRIYTRVFCVTPY